MVCQFWEKVLVEITFLTAYEVPLRIDLILLTLWQGIKISNKCKELVTIMLSHQGMYQLSGGITLLPFPNGTLQWIVFLLIIIYTQRFYVGSTLLKKRNYIKGLICLSEEHYKNMMLFV